MIVGQNEVRLNVATMKKVAEEYLNARLRDDAKIKVDAIHTVGSGQSMEHVFDVSPATPKDGAK